MQIPFFRGKGKPENFNFHSSADLILAKRREEVRRLSASKQSQEKTARDPFINGSQAYKLSTDITLHLYDETQGKIKKLEEEIETLRKDLKSRPMQGAAASESGDMQLNSPSIFDSIHSFNQLYGTLKRKVIDYSHKIDPEGKYINRMAKWVIGAAAAIVVAGTAVPVTLAYFVSRNNSVEAVRAQVKKDIRDMEETISKIDSDSSSLKDNFYLFSNSIYKVVGKAVSNNNQQIVEFQDSTRKAFASTKNRLEDKMADETRDRQAQFRYLSLSFEDLEANGPAYEDEIIILRQALSSAYSNVAAQDRRIYRLERAFGESRQREDEQKRKYDALQRKIDDVPNAASTNNQSSTNYSGGFMNFGFFGRRR